MILHVSSDRIWWSLMSSHGFSLVLFTHLLARRYSCSLRRAHSLAYFAQISCSKLYDLLEIERMWLFKWSPTEWHVWPCLIYSLLQPLHKYSPLEIGPMLISRERLTFVSFLFRSISIWKLLCPDIISSDFDSWYFPLKISPLKNCLAWPKKYVILFWTCRKYLRKSIG